MHRHRALLLARGCLGHSNGDELRRHRGQVRHLRALLCGVIEGKMVNFDKSFFPVNAAAPLRRKTVTQRTRSIVVGAACPGGNRRGGIARRSGVYVGPTRSDHRGISHLDEDEEGEREKEEGAALRGCHGHTFGWGAWGVEGLDAGVPVSDWI